MVEIATRGIPALAFFGIELVHVRPSKTIENPQTIGENIKKRRLALKAWQKDVAAILGVSEDTITYWENNRSKPYIRHYPKIIDFLGYDPYSYDAATLRGRMNIYRHKNGLSQFELARILGADESTGFNWEKENHVPMPTKQKMLEVLLPNRKELST